MKRRVQLMAAVVLARVAGHLRLLADRCAHAAIPGSWTCASGDVAYQRVDDLWDEPTRYVSKVGITQALRETGR